MNKVQHTKTIFQQVFIFVVFILGIAETGGGQVRNLIAIM
jgi:hypothetical protein